VYEKDGIRFSHYSDWSIEEDGLAAGAANTRAIQIGGPNHALFSILCFPEKSSMTLEEFASSVAEKRVAAIKRKFSFAGLDLAQMTRGSSGQTKSSIRGEEQSGIRQRFSITLLGEQVPHEAEFFMLRSGGFKVVLMTQAAQEHLQDVRAAWQKIFDTISFEGLAQPRPSDEGKGLEN
jgi:hypothetical protein